MDENLYMNFLKNKIPTIKFIRWNTNCCLVNAKNALEFVIDYPVGNITYETFLKLLNMACEIAKKLERGEYYCKDLRTDKLYKKEYLSDVELTSMGLIVEYSEKFSRSDVNIYREKEISFIDYNL